MPKLKFFGDGKMKKYSGNFECRLNNIVEVSEDDFNIQMTKHPDWWEVIDEKTEVTPPLERILNSHGKLQTDPREVE